MSGINRLSFDCEFKFADGDSGMGTVEGYASMFGLMDKGGDIVMPGAFKASLSDWRKRKAAPPMLWNHDPDMPIGVWPEISEDEKGLKVKGTLLLDVPQAKTVRALMMGGAVKGLSIGYVTKEAEIDRQTGARRLKKVDLWEISPVTFPMLPEAYASVKMSNFDPRELENALREAGLSRADAVKAVGVLRKTLQRDVGGNEPGPRDAAADALMAIRKATAALQG